MIGPMNNVPQILSDVGTRLNRVETNAATAMNTLGDIVDKLAQAAQNIIDSTGSISVDIKLPTPINLERPERPSEFVPTPPEYGRPPEPDPITGPTPLTIPDAPPANFGTAPTALRSYTGRAPTNDVRLNIPEISGAPTLTRPERGTLADINIRTFGGVEPTYSPTYATTPGMSSSIERYTESTIAPIVTMLQAHIDELNSRIRNGGTGLPAVVEAAIWNRAYDREAQLARGAEQDVLRQDAALGFPLPAGGVQSKLMRIRTENMAKMATIGRDIAIKQAELELANVQKALELLPAVEQIYVQFESATRQRILDAVRQSNEAALQIYDAVLKGFLASEESRKIGVSVFQAEIQAYEAKVRAYAAEIGAEQSKADVNKAIISQYVAELEANTALLDAYKSEVEATVAIGKMEELKLKAFEVEVAAFDAETRGFLAEAQGKNAEMQIFAERVRAYQSEVQGYSAVVDAKTKAKSAEIEAYRAKQDANRIKLEAYRALVDAEGGRASAEAQAAGAIAQSESIYASAVGSFNNVNASMWNAVAQAQIQVANTTASVSRMNADVLQASRAMSMDASKTTAQVYSQLLSSIMSQAHYSLGASGSVTKGESESANYGFEAASLEDMPDL